MAYDIKNAKIRGFHTVCQWGGRATAYVFSLGVRLVPCRPPLTGNVRRFQPGIPPRFRCWDLCSRSLWVNRLFVGAG